MISFSKTRAILGLGLFLALPLGCTPFDRAVMDGAAPDGDAASATGDAHGGVGGAGGTSASGGSGGTAIDGGGVGSSDAQIDVADDEKLADVGAEPDAPKSDGGAPDGSAAADAPASADTAPAAELGGVCGADAACKSGHCVGGVCCNSTCLAGCTSCRAIDTGAAEGTCAAVKAGLAHANDCATTTATSCGTDGKCDGKGACRKWMTGTICGAATCANGTSTSIATPTCDGSGMCSPGASKSCGTYLCNGAAATCNTTCTDGTACASTSYCDGAKACVAKKAAGSLCLTSAECSSGACGGRCCAAGTPCLCPQPNAKNLLQNPGFETNLSGWALIDGAGGDPTTHLGWASEDSSNDTSGNPPCPFSGSAHLTSTGFDLRQCVSLDPTKTYNVGGRTRGKGGYTVCDFVAFPSQGCAGTESLVYSISWSSFYWSASLGGPTRGAVVSGKSSLRVICYLLPYTAGDPPPQEGFVDQIFVSESPNEF
jgi:hypothetical protein